LRNAGALLCARSFFLATDGVTVSLSSNIGALMAPRNVVLVGASDRNWAPRIWDNL